MKIKFICLFFAIFFILALQAGRHERFREIDHMKPKYMKRKSDAWKEGGRLIGEVKHTPDSFTIKFANAGTGKVIYTYTHSARLSIYQTKHLPTGTYDIIVDAEGFLPQKIKNIKIKARADCLLNLIFGLRVFDNS